MPAEHWWRMTLEVTSVRIMGSSKETHDRRCTMGMKGSHDTEVSDVTDPSHRWSVGLHPTLPDEGGSVTTDTQLLLSVEEAADVLRLGRTRTYELVMTRKIQSVKVGRRRLVVRSSLFDFVQTLLLEQDSA